MNKNVELSVHPAFVDEANGYRFEPLRDEKGKKVYRHPRVGEWYITEDAEIARHPRCEDDECGQILRAIPINPPPYPSCSTCSHEYEPKMETVAPPKPSKQWKRGEWAFHPEYKLLYIASETDIHGEPGFIFHPLHSGNTNVIISGHHLDVLREVRDDDWPVGAPLVYAGGDDSIWCLNRVKNGMIYIFDESSCVSREWYDKPEMFRPPQDSDWIVDINGVKYRAHGGSQELIKLRQWNEKNKWWEDYIVTKEIVKALGVQVMPLEFQGN